VIERGLRARRIPRLTLGFSSTGELRVRNGAERDRTPEVRRPRKAPSPSTGALCRGTARPCDNQTPDGQWIFGPDFLIIGAARSGTTWLRRNASGGVSAIRIKPGEPNYFSFHPFSDPRDYIASLSTGVKNADLPHAGSPRLYGEKSPSYLLMPNDKIALVQAPVPAGEDHRHGAQSGRPRLVAYPRPDRRTTGPCPTSATC